MSCDTYPFTPPPQPPAPQPPSLNPTPNEPACVILTLPRYFSFFFECNAIYVEDVKDRSNTPKGCNAMYVEDVEDGKKKHTHIFAHKFLNPYHAGQILPILC